MSAYQVPSGLDKEAVRSTLDALARDGAQRMLVSALELEIEDFLGRARYDHGPRRRRGYRNGVGKLRKISVGCGTLEVRPPRVRDSEEPFRSQLLPRYQRSSDAVQAVLLTSTSRAWPPEISNPRSARCSARRVKSSWCCQS